MDPFLYLFFPLLWHMFYVQFLSIVLLSLFGRPLLLSSLFVSSKQLALLSPIGDLHFTTWSTNTGSLPNPPHIVAYPAMFCGSGPYCTSSNAQFYLKVPYVTGVVAASYFLMVFESKSKKMINLNCPL